MGWRRTVNSGNIHCTYIHVHTGTDLGTAERGGREVLTVTIYTVLIYMYIRVRTWGPQRGVEENGEQWQYTLYPYTCTYRYRPGDSREGWRRTVNSGNIHCTHIHVHTGTDLGVAERGGGEEKYEQWQYTLYSYTCTYR